MSPIILWAAASRNRRAVQLIMLASVLTSPPRAVALTSAPDAASLPAPLRHAHITALTSGGDDLLVGTEANGLWRWKADAERTGTWQQIAGKRELGPDNAAYALCRDRAGALWVGTLRHGVAVYNGVRWRGFGPLDGPIGARVFAMALSPRDGSMWIATEAGVTRYRIVLPARFPEFAVPKAEWRTFTRAGGLPADQATSLAFDRDGRLYVATACNGVAIGSPADDYHHWAHVPGPASMPATPTGAGLPSKQTNAVVVAEDGSVYVGTTCGMAWSSDHGRTWRYRRGLNWRARVTGLYKGPAPQETPVHGDLLLEDYVTTLTCLSNERLLVGHREQGYEVISRRTMLRQREDVAGNAFVTAVAPQGRDTVVGTYGGGIRVLAGTAPAAPTSLAAQAKRRPVLCSPALTAEELEALAKSEEAERPTATPGEVSFLGEDWQTQGNWMGRYGQGYAILWAVEAPFNDEYLPANYGEFSAVAELGPNRREDDRIRHWLQWPRTDDRRTLFEIIWNRRRQAEIDDHGETYPREIDGPDIWIAITVPKGVHRVSFYFFNKDGDDGDNRCRDYLIQWHPFIRQPEETAAARRALTPPQPSGVLADLDAALRSRVLAESRVRDFRGGVYHRFVANGPARFLVRLARNGSHNVICSGTFIDPIAGPHTNLIGRTYPGMEDVPTGPARNPQPTPGDPVADAAQRLWLATFRKAGTRAFAQSANERMIQVCRALAARPAQESLFQDRCSDAALWTPADDEIFAGILAMLNERKAGKTPP